MRPNLSASFGPKKRARYQLCHLRSLISSSRSNTDILEALKIAVDYSRVGFRTVRAERSRLEFERTLQNEEWPFLRVYIKNSIKDLAYENIL